MNELINWVSLNNTLMIQICFTVVLVLLVVYVYRLFFVVSSGPAETSSGNFEVSQLNQKIEQLLQQKIDGQSNANSNPGNVSSGQVASAASSSDRAEVQQLRAEVSTLRNALNESEKKVFDMSPSATSDAAGLVENKIGEEKAAELSAKVEQLEARLAEYDVIAEDIAELSQLRSENSELKKRLNLSDDTMMMDSVSENPAEVNIDSHSSEQPLSQNTIDELLGESVDLPKEFSAVESQEDTQVPDIIPEAKSTSKPEGPAKVEPFISELNSEILDVEKSVLNEFEKLMQKGST